MANNSFQVKKSLNIQPAAAPTLNEAGDIGFDSNDNQLKLNDGASTKAVVTDSAAQTLTNKTVDAAQNTISNIDLSMTTLPAETALDLATSNSATTINIGTGSGTNTINIGGADTSINLIGSVFSQDVTDLVVSDKLITINDGGAAGSALGSGIEVEEDSVITASVKISTDRNSWELKAPNTAGIASLTPGASNDVVTLNAATQVITNKDIDGGTASNTRRITLPKDTKTNLDALTRKQGTLIFDTTSNKPYYDDGSVLKVIGSGSGGAVNFIEGGDAESGTTGWATYADAAGTRPVDGTGGTANVTFIVSGTSPLSGSNSFLLTKDAANRQGEGVSYDLSVDNASLAKVLKIDFDYIVNSGTFVAGSSTTDSDIIVYLYDRLNNRLLEPSTIKLFSNSSSIPDKFSAYFQVNADSRFYRLIFHVASTSALAYELKIDNVSVSPSQYVYGTPITDWQAYTPTFTNFGTPTSVNFIWRRVGDSVQIKGNFVAGTTTAAEARISLPSVVSKSTLPTIGLADGKLIRGNTTANNVKDFDVLIEPSVGYVTFGFHEYALALPSLSKRNGDGIMGSGETASLYAQVPISGWSSSVQMSDSADTRVVAFKAFQSVSQTGIAPNSSSVKINFNSVATDTAGTYSTVQQRYNVQTAGIFTFNAGVTINGTNVLANNYALQIWINGTYFEAIGGLRATASAFFNISGTSSPVPLKAGDFVEVYLFGLGNNSASTLSTDSTASQFSGLRISGPSAIAATETIAARYEDNTAPSIPNNAFTALSTLGTRVYDSHVMVSGGSITIPATGRYHFSIQRRFAANGTGDRGIQLRKNGTAFSQSYSRAGTGGSGFGDTVQTSTDINCIAGDVITAALFQSSGGSLSLTSDTEGNNITWHRIGL